MANARKYLDAMQVQDASNLSGIMFAYERCLAEILNTDMPLVRQTGYYTNVWIGHHPAIVLFTSKMLDLGQVFGSTVDQAVYGAAYDLVKAIEEYPDSEVCPGCHRPIEWVGKTGHACAACETWPAVRKVVA